MNSHHLCGRGQRGAHVLAGLYSHTALQTQGHIYASMSHDEVTQFLGAYAKKTIVESFLCESTEDSGYELRQFLPKHSEATQ